MTDSAKHTVTDWTNPFAHGQQVSSHNVYLKNESGEYVPADLHEGISDKHLTDRDKEWMPLIPRSTVQYEWDWRGYIQSVEIYSTYAIECNGITQGLMALKNNPQLALAGGPLIYVSLLESAPWNYLPAGSFNYPRLKDTGTVLITTAARISMKLGYEGRVGLHSTEQAENFYLRTGMTRNKRDANFQECYYFELLPAVARSLVRS